MTKYTKHEPGTFCWIELHTSDGEAAKRFYCDLLGWTPNEMPMGEGQPPYIIVQKDGRDAGAMYQNKEVPPGWLSYVCVDSVDDTAAKVKELGGKTTSDPFDVVDLGRMVVFADPEGAHLALWQPKKHIGVQVKNETGALCWTELQTRQRDRAQEFYTKLFGWTAKASPEYVEFHTAAGEAIGGMMTMQPQVPVQVPANWLVYFWADDVDASVKKAGGGGATTLVPPMDIPNVGRFAVLSDPQGAVFALFKGSM